jgi:hypothetical protein
MRSDPTELGGLFIGRRPGTGPVSYAEEPHRGTPLRRRADALLATGLLLAIASLSLACWGPLPLACLWLGSRAQDVFHNSNLGILVSFAATFAALFGNLAVLRRLDYAWVIVRRAAGHDQRTGALARIFAFAAVVGVVAFSFWFLVIQGPNDPNL